MESKIFVNSVMGGEQQAVLVFGSKVSYERLDISS
jgi:hypothetical protein